MKHIKFILVFLFAISCVNPAFSKIDVEKSLYNAFLSNDYRRWATVVSAFEPESDMTLLQDRLKLIHCYYGYVSVLIDKKKTDEAKNAIIKAEKLITDGLSQYPNNALLLDYQGAFISYRISMNKLKGISLGKKAITLINKAYSIEPNNVQILFDKGNACYYPPKMFGGDKQEALGYFQKAIRIVEQSGKTKNNWVYLQMIFLEARCLELLGNTEEAIKAYKKVLSIEAKFNTAKVYYQKLISKK